MTARKALLVTGTDMTGDTVGALYLRRLISFDSGFTVIPHVLMSSNFITRFFGGGRLGSILGAGANRLGWLQSLRLFVYRKFYVKRAAQNILEIASKENAQAIWLTLSSAELILLAAELVRDGNDVRVTIWDVPEYLAESLRLGARTTNALLSSFASVVSLASAISVVSFAMQKRYQQAFGAQPLVIRHAIDEQRSKRKEITLGGNLRVVFSGSLYSKMEWNSFIAALDSVDWQINNRKVVVYFIGSYPARRASRSRRVRRLGAMSYSSTANILRRCDIGYLPYWFSDQKRLVAETSFPGKLSAYLEAGIAVFSHAPAYSEVARLLDVYSFGINCRSCNLKDIIESLEFLDRYKSTEQCRNEINRVIQSELSAKIMRDRFVAFLGTAPSRMQYN